MGDASWVAFWNSFGGILMYFAVILSLILNFINGRLASKNKTKIKDNEERAALEIAEAADAAYQASRAAAAAKNMAEKTKQKQNILVDFMDTNSGSWREHKAKTDFGNLD
jgi:hypothetical protein